MVDNKISALAAQIVSARVSRGDVPTNVIPNLIRSVQIALSAADGQAPIPPVVATIPRVSAEQSIFTDRILCMECGKSMKMLKRHLRNDHKLTVEEYRAKYNLPSTYPMVTPNYAKRRSAIAKEIGLGHSRSRPRLPNQR